MGGPYSLPRGATGLTATSSEHDLSAARARAAAFYARHSAQSGPGLRAVLQLDPAATLIAYGRGAQAEALLSLDIGWQRVVDAHFRHRPPRPAELEEAIAAVEDALAAARPAPPAGLVPVSGDAALRAIALAAGRSSSAEGPLARDDVEQVFQRLVGVAHGRPAAREGIPEDAAFAASLTLLRELMHHLDFPSVVIAR